MRAKRPKKTISVSQHEGADLRRKWRKWIGAIAKDVGGQLLDFDTFVELKSIVATNPAIQTPNHLHNWTFKNYVVTATVSIRRLDDTDKRSHSLWRMLYEMLEYPGVLTKDWHISLYSHTPELGPITFANLAGPGAKCLGPKRIRGDLRKIELSCKRLRRLVNKRIAHVGAKGSLRKKPTYDELRSALSEIDSIVCRYQLLLTAHSSDTQKPTCQYDWTEVLRKPWLPTPKP